MAVAVVAAVLVAGCSSTVGGQAAPVPGAATSSPSPTSGSRAPTSTSESSGGITAPTSPGLVPAASQEPDGAAGTIGYPGIGDVRQGKFFELELTAASAEQARQLASEVADKVLANPVIESFRVEVE